MAFADPSKRNTPPPAMGSELADEYLVHAAAAVEALLEMEAPREAYIRSRKMSARRCWSKVRSLINLGLFRAAANNRCVAQSYSVPGSHTHTSSSSSSSSS